MITSRDFFNTILANDPADEIREYAEHALAKMDERNAKRTSKPSKRTLENEPIKAKIVEILADGGKTTAEIATALEVTVQKASGLCVALVKDGKVKAEDVKLPKVGTRKFYTLAE